MSKPHGSHDLASELEVACALLERIAADRGLLAQVGPEARRRLLTLAGEVFNPDIPSRRQYTRATQRARKRARVDREEGVLRATGIRALRQQPVFMTPNYFPPAGFHDHDPDEVPRQETAEAQNCYICKQDYTAVHHFYDQLCPDCAAFNFGKRTELADLRGRVALLTGGRVKIGYQAGIKLLRSGARLIVTTRFPRDAAERYAGEPDFDDWRDRLEIHGLDLRHTPSVEDFCRELAGGRDRLDFIVNNACQTVRRPPEFYRHMMEGEREAAGRLPARARALLGTIGRSHSAELSQVALLPEEREVQEALFPLGRLDQDLQQVDLRGRNSWRLLLHEVPPVELLEVHLINAIAPFIFNARLKPLMLRGPGRDKHIVNVSAVEGQFYRRFKTTRHPHTNMAKAALNMMTRTAAADYHADGIHMNSVDTGWVTDEDPADLAAAKQAEHRFHPPLDIVDGAARIVDPIIAGVNTGEHIWGQFLKDYRPADW